MSLNSGVKITADVDDLTRKLDYAMGRIVNVVATLSYSEPDVRPAGRPKGRAPALRIAAAVSIASYCASARYFPLKKT